MTPAKGFAEMKDSGIEWVGMIPNHWTTIANKYVMHKEKHICEKWDGQDVLSLTMNGVIIRDILNPVGKMPTTFDGYQFAYAGELLMCLFDIDVTPRCVGRVFNDGVTSPAYSCFQLNDNADLGYFYYYYLMVDNTKELLHLAKNLRHSFTEEQLGQLKVPLPPLQEQSAIASYLDTQCAKIDEIIAQAKASIEDYKQWKASIIYEAVTKGLDPNVEMKESGIPCVDEIPKSWTVTRFGKIATVKSNLVNPKDYQSYKQISPENIEKGSGVLLDCGTVEESGVISGNHLFYKGQILYSKIRPTLNKVIIAPFDGLCSADMYPIDTDHCSRFILYLMLSAYFNEQVALVTGNRVKMPKINQNELSQIMVAIPSGTEEQQIAKYLDSSCSQIDVLIKEKQSLLDDLESYKKSLIYEIVTGKRSVQQ